MELNRGVAARILITTFETWLPHQVSNASEDLLRLLEAQDALPQGCHVLHQLPVCTETAYAWVESAIKQHQPAYVICCGMAEQRQRLSLETRAIMAQNVLWSPISLTQFCSLRRTLRRAEISYDAGRFVCNGIYYALLQRFWDIAAAQGGDRPDPTPAQWDNSAVIPNPAPLFVHVPLLTARNQTDLVQDFHDLLRQLLSQL